MKRNTLLGLLLLALLMTLGINAHAAVDTALSGAVTDYSGFWTTIYNLKITIALGVIGVVWLKRIR